MISATVELTQPLRERRQFVAHTGSGHELLLDDTAGGTGPKPIELIAQYGETVAMLEHRGWSRGSLFPHGGNQMSLAIAAGFGLGGAESYPGVFGAFGGFADDATVDDGFLPLSDRPGIGFEGQAALYALMRPLAE